MSYYVADLILVFLEKFSCRTECYLVDVPVDFFLGHTDSAVDDFQCPVLFVKLYTYGKVTQFPLEIT